MKTTTKRNHLNVKVRRGLFAWGTLVFFLLALATLLFYSLNILESAIVMDSIIELSNQRLGGMTSKMETDLVLNRELQNYNLLMLLKFIPLYVVTFLTIYIWSGSKKSFIRSLLFK